MRLRALGGGDVARFGIGGPAARPPSRGMTAPVTKLASADSRWSTTAAASAPRPTQPSGAYSAEPTPGRVSLDDDGRGSSVPVLRHEVSVILSGRRSPQVRGSGRLLEPHTVSGMTVLVQGVLGGVSALAAQLAHWGGATVVGTVRHQGDLERVNGAAVTHAVALDQPDPAAAIRAYAPEGVDRIIEVAFSDNVDLDSAVAKNDAVIAAYATRQERPDMPFWPLLFNNVTIRLVGSDDVPAAAKQQAVTDLTAAARDGALSIATGAPLPLERTAEAHDRVDAGGRERVLLKLPD
jgi:NADPH:quinone reductase